MIKLLEKNCKFLITGATGFIGSRLCKEILQDGHKIIALTRQKNLPSYHQNLKYINDLAEVDFDFDIVIASNSNTKAGSYSEPSGSYQHPMAVVPNYEIDSGSFLAGSSGFLTGEIEVYQVIENKNEKII